DGTLPLTHCVQGNNVCRSPLRQIIIYTGGLLPLGYITKRQHCPLPDGNSEFFLVLRIKKAAGEAASKQNGANIMPD
ncbi:hypothetical protein R1K40_29900, partial [Klebsiella sp. 104352]|uniref:hypothetical protein n=1 Tax=Klebsiella sp. 104352 TaxID=3079197 RepID=UPI003005785E